MHNDNVWPLTFRPHSLQENAKLISAGWGQRLVVKVHLSHVRNLTSQDHTFDFNEVSPSLSLFNDRQMVITAYTSSLFHPKIFRTDCIVLSTLKIPQRHKLADLIAFSWSDCLLLQIWEFQTLLKNIFEVNAFLYTLQICSVTCFLHFLTN